ncbi:MAG: hypothetical protein K2X63_00690 [Burkholderiaceae bacterium]|nr:hypothetical protein [Burkholderiaceae bacterium]
MSNLFKVFQSLLPDAPLLVGSIIAVQSNGYIISLPGGAQISARGTASLGQKVFVRDNVIQGQAPDLPVTVIEI